MTIAVYLPDLMRSFVIMSILVNLMFFPMALRPYAGIMRVWLLVLGCEALFLSFLARSIDNLGSPIKWYGAPLVAFGMVFITIYVFYALADQNRKGRS